MSKLTPFKDWIETADANYFNLEQRHLDETLKNLLNQAYIAGQRDGIRSVGETISENLSKPTVDHQG